MADPAAIGERTRVIGARGALALTLTAVIGLAPALLLDSGDGLAPILEPDVAYAAADAPCGGPPMAAPDRVITDRVRGGKGADRLRGREGDDCLAGNRGRDRLRGDAGEDLLRGGRGTDRLRAVDGEADAVRCGKGKRDRARIDRGLDQARGCERVRRA